MMDNAFTSLTFREPAQAEERIQTLLADERDGLAEHLAHALGEAADPDTVLVRLEHYLNASFSASIELDNMAQSLEYTRLVCTLLGQSHYLTDILCRNPEYLSWLWSEVDLDRTPTAEELVEELTDQMAPLETAAKRLDAMRRYYRRSILRIGARDVFRHASVVQLTLDLANLADAMLEVAYRDAWAALTAQFGRPMVEEAESPVSLAGFCVLAMGKHGGRELNFSSDIDLLFIYSGEGRTEGGATGKLSNAEFFHKLGERIIKAIAEKTSEGDMFRVDMRLRPHGKYGPLATTVDSCLQYYQTQGQAWERQALVKARPVAGDLSLGDEFIARTRPFVYPRFFDDETLEEILNVKRQTETKIADRGERDREVKLGRGGIRDIEFTVQMLQLLNGGRFAELRTSNTLEAIDVLGEYSLLSPFEATTLASNYAFLRQVEHRLQIEGSQQRHALPADPQALDLLARQLGYTSGESYMREYRERADATHEILERFYARKGGGTLWVTDLLNPASDAEEGLTHLAQMGFGEPNRARAELLELAHGKEGHGFTAHVRQRFVEVAPALLEALAASHDPDRALMRVGQLFANLRAPGGMYDILHRHPSLSRWLVLLVANSEYLTDILTRDPGLFEAFGTGGLSLDRAFSKEELEEELVNLTRAFEGEAAPYRLRDGETLRIGLRELFENITVLEVGYELTNLAEVCLEHALAEARAEAEKRFGKTDAAFAVLGLGKMGGREMGYGSDLDLIFVYDGDAALPAGVDAVEFFTFVSSRTIKTLSARTRYGVLYEIDARLRPHGGKGALAVSAAGLEQYYAQQAQPWERLALVKVRPVAGSGAFGETVASRARDLAFSLPLTSEVLDHIDDIRRRINETGSKLELKKDEGGLIEVEFAVRLLQLRYAAQVPELKRGDVLGAIDALTTHGMLSSEDFSHLAMSYLLFRRIENRIRMMQGRSGSSLPESDEESADLAKRLRVQGDLLQVVSEHKRKAHATFVKVLEELRHAAGS
jgi:glutamate-ammonia-ligase adenylyltransferase